MAEGLTAADRLRKGLDEFLGTSGAGLEEVVNSKAFGDMLAQVTGNLVAISRIGGETMDLLIRNARLAGRRDVSELGRQLARNEDKLEAVLALVEELQDELKTARAQNATASPKALTAEGTPTATPADESADNAADDASSEETPAKAKPAARSGARKTAASRPAAEQE